MDEELVGILVEIEDIRTERKTAVRRLQATQEEERKRG
jgi:hypothetical protein